MTLRRAITVFFVLTWLSVSVGYADTTDREHKPGSVRSEEAHEDAWKSLLQEPLPLGGSGSPPAEGTGIPAGLEVILKRAGCDASNPNLPTCEPSGPTNLGGTQP